MAIADGGTGASDAANARINLGLGNMAVQNSSGVTITGGSLTQVTVSSLITDLAIADGGTGASDAANARINLGLGNMSLQAPSNVAITGGSITGITDLVIADGGTGASDAANARINLGLGNIPTTFIPGTIATQNSNNVTITGGTITGITDLAIADGGTGASDAGTARNNLGLGNIATQSANNVSIVGGIITGITDLAIADGGTGASNAANARENLGAASQSTYIGPGPGLAGGGFLSAANVDLSISPDSNGYGYRNISTSAPFGNASDGDIWYQI